MIPSPDQLQAVSRLREGDLSEIPFAVLLHALAQSRRTAVLEIERTPLKKEIILENGVPVDCRSNLLHETLGRFLVSRGLLSEEDSQILLAKATSSGVQLGETLILEGRLTATELYRHLQQNLAKKLLDGFSWRSGRFRIQPDPPAVESPLKVKVSQLVLTGISRFASQDEVNGSIGDIVGKRLCLAPDCPYPLSEIRLSAKQQELMPLLEKGKRIDELAAECRVPFDDITRLIYALAVIGAVVPEDQLKGRSPATRPVELPKASALEGTWETPTSGLPLPKELASGEVEERRNQLMETYLRHRRQDSLELLGLEEDADAVDVEQGYLDFCERFAPWDYESPALQDLREKAEDLFLAGGRAFGELCDAERRNALLMRRSTLRQQREAQPDPERFAIKSDLLDSEHQFQRGKALMEKHSYSEALTLLEFAHDCDPQNSEYRAELAYCRYMAAPETEADRALEELSQTLRIDRRCGLAFYYSGLIRNDLGNRVEAEEHLRRAIKLMMPDRRPIEALKSLQSASGSRR